MRVKAELGCFLVAALIGSAQGQTTKEVVVHSFGDISVADPHAPPIADALGNLYGTANSGGAGGEVYEINTAGNFTILYAFTGGTDGSGPQGGVVRDSAGNLYGTTEFGGATGNGVVFKVDPSGHETVLHSFLGGTLDGSQPIGGATVDASGNVYGGTLFDGPQNGGIVFKIDPAGDYTILHSFGAGPTGCYPAGVALDAAGNLYGTANGCGASNVGLIYEIDIGGNFTVLHTFAGGADGANPYFGVVLDEAGNIYGSASHGGTRNQGLLFKLDIAGNYTVLHDFAGTAEFGAGPSGVTLDAAGNLYGTAAPNDSDGIVYKLDGSGDYTVLHSFNGNRDGSGPVGVSVGASGLLYGTTASGGTLGGGVVYSLDTGGRETLLHRFTSGTRGNFPLGGVIEDAAGNLYGTTIGGGDSGGYNGNGVVYRISATGDYSVLYTFTGSLDGGDPRAGVIQDAAGNLYGTAYKGGTEGFGVVFEISASGQETVLYDFTAKSGTTAPTPNGLILGPQGNLYGTTVYGGAYREGEVYRLDTAGNQAVLHEFTGGDDGGQPLAGVIRGGANDLIGTASTGGSLSHGVVFRLDENGSETVLHSFTGGTDGGQPEGGVVRDADGNLYGTTYTGGTKGECAGYGNTNGCGVVFKLDGAGQETVLHTFAGSEGALPGAGLVMDSDGNLYGSTTAGGPANAGVIFEIDIAGVYSVLYAFTGAQDGRNPSGPLIRSAAGVLHGTTYWGGKCQTGVVFKLTTRAGPL